MLTSGPLEWKLNFAHGVVLGIAGLPQREAGVQLGERLSWTGPVQQWKSPVIKHHEQGSLKYSLHRRSTEAAESCRIGSFATIVLINLCFSLASVGSCRMLQQAALPMMPRRRTGQRRLGLDIPASPHC